MGNVQAVIDLPEQLYLALSKMFQGQNPVIGEIC